MVEKEKHSVSNVTTEQLYCRRFNIKPKSKKNWRIREQSWNNGYKCNIEVATLNKARYVGSYFLFPLTIHAVYVGETW